MGGIRITVPDVLYSASERGYPDTLTTPRHRIAFARTPVGTGDPITSVPVDVGNSVDIITPPALRANPFYYAAFRGTAGEREDQIRLADEPPITFLGFTTVVVARFKDVALGSGWSSLFYMMPPGGNRSDLSLWDLNGAKTLRWASGVGGNTINHPWTPDTGWHVFSVTQSGNSLAVGVDGVEVTATGFEPLPASGFNIGQRRGGGFSMLDVADVAIFPYMQLADRKAEFKNLGDYYNIPVT